MGAMYAPHHSLHLSKVDPPVWNQGPSLTMHLATQKSQHNYPSNSITPLRLANLWKLLLPLGH